MYWGHAVVALLLIAAIIMVYRSGWNARDGIAKVDAAKQVIDNAKALDAATKRSNDVSMDYEAVVTHLASQEPEIRTRVNHVIKTKTVFRNAACTIDASDLGMFNDADPATSPDATSKHNDAVPSPADSR